MQVYDRRTTGMHWQSHKVGARHYRVGEERREQRMDVAVALGGDPVNRLVGLAAAAARHGRDRRLRHHPRAAGRDGPAARP